MAYMNIYNYDIYNTVPKNKVTYADYYNEDEALSYVEIDDDIVYVIQTLNRKGYFTRFCCSGHYGYDSSELYDENINNGYIFFKDAVNFKSLPKCVKQESSHIIRFWFESESNTTERFYELNNIVRELSIWADGLASII